MPDTFNPYREWLGLESVAATPDHYALLGLPQNEQDPQRIQQAAERATIRVRSHRPGAQAADWARILDEIQAAKNCLLDPQARAAYDRALSDGGPGVATTPRMEVEVSPASRDRLPPGITTTSAPPAPANSAPVVSSFMPPTPPPEPLPSAAPFNPAPSTVAAPTWDPAPGMPPAAWGAPLAAAQPMAPHYGYGAPPSSDPMAPAMPMAGNAQLASAQHAYAPPAAMDPMAPAYGAPAPYGNAPPAAGMYAGAMPPPSAYTTPDPMQPLAPSSAYYPPVADAAPPMAAIPMALPAQSTSTPPSYSFGIGPPQTAAPVAAAPTAIAPVGTPVLASVPQALPAGSEVSIRSTRPRRGNNGLLLAGVGVGGALLLLGVGIVLMNQQRDPVVATNPSPPTIPTTPNTIASDIDSSDKSPSLPAPMIPKPEVPATPPPREPEPTTLEPTPPKPPQPEPAKSAPTPEPVKPEPPQAEPPKPAVPKPGAKPTKEQVQALSTLLKQARQALRETRFEEAQAKLAEAEPLPKTEDQAVVVRRLEQLTMQAAAYRNAFTQGKEKLAVGQKLAVTASTQPEIVELDSEKISIDNKGEKRSYEWKSLPLGLFYAIADSAFETGDVQRKVQRGAYLIALAEDAKDAEKGKSLWDEAIAEGASLTLLLPVITDNYELANLEMVAKVEPPEMKPETPAPSNPDTPSPKPNANSTAALPLLKKAREEIGGHQFSEAQASLTKAEPLLANDVQQGKHARLMMLLDYTKQFKDAIDRTLVRLESGSTFEVGRTVVSVVEVRPREVVVRVNGTNRTYQRTEMPIGMAVALGDMSLQKDSPEAKLIRGAYVVACSGKPEDIEKAKAWWREAAGSVDVNSLLPVVDDTYTK